MKKSKTIRILCVALALLLISQFAVTAFAATSGTWSDGIATYYMETDVINNATARDQAAISTTTIWHTQWDTTTLWGYYDMTVDEYWIGKEYGNTVVSTAARDGYDDKYIEYNLELQDPIGGMDADEPSGYYYVLADTKNYKINYTVYRNDGGGYEAYYVDTVYAPYDIYEDVVSGYRAA